MSIMHHRSALRRRRSRERGASLVEYALLVALIAVVCIGAVTFLGTSGSSNFDKAGKGVDGAAANPYEGWACQQGYDPDTGSPVHRFKYPTQPGYTSTVAGPCP